MLRRPEHFRFTSFRCQPQTAANCGRTALRLNLLDVKAQDIKTKGSISPSCLKERPKRLINVIAPVDLARNQPRAEFIRSALFERFV